MLTGSPVANVDSDSSTTTSPASTPIRASSPSSCDLREDRERGPHGALRVVLVRPRHAEGRHHRVAGELLDHPAVLLDARRRMVEVLAHAAADDLGVDGADERGRVDEVDEEHGCELAFQALNCTRGGYARRSAGLRLAEHLGERLEQRPRHRGVVLHERAELPRS